MLSSVAVFGDRFSGDVDGPLSLTMTRSARRGPWLPEEDQALLRLVRTQGANNWVRISQQVQHRSPKQCRERYHQNLKPSLKHDPISAQEGEVIERLVHEMGKRWAEIARRLGNRSDNAVKNWWNGSVNRRRRNPGQSTGGFKQVGSRLQPLPFTLPAEYRYTQRTSLTLEPKNSIHTPSYEKQHDTLSSVRPTSQDVSHPTYAQASSITETSSPSQFGHYIDTSAQSTQTCATANNALRPSLPKVNTSGSRPELPPLRSSSFHLSYSERLNTMERPPISPALSDTSQRHAPSLISDNQSMYSISPRTVTTPRPGILAPLEIGTSTWLDVQSIPQHNQPCKSYKGVYHLDAYPRYGNHPPVDPALHRSSISSTGEERLKDSRMNVSTLLQ